MLWYEKLYNILNIIVYSCLILAYLGLWTQAPDYLNTFDYYLKIFVAVVLVIVYNPFIRFRYTDFHRRLSFSAGIFLLTSTGLTSILNHFKHIKDKLTKSS